MDVSWISPLLLACCLSLHMVRAQFGVFFDSNLANYRYYKSLACKVNNIYIQGFTIDQMYTDRNDANCCYLVSSRNQCCEETGYNFLNNQFISKCRCDPSVTCGVTTTATTTTTPAPSQLFCPKVGGRILNSLPVTDNCGPFPGVVPVLRMNPGSTPGETAICNAVLTQAFVSGVSKTTLVTSQFCRQIADAAENFSGNLQIRASPTLLIPYSRFTRITGNDGAAFLDPDSATVQQLMSSCKTTACGLRHPEMSGKIDYDNCQVLSYGSYQSDTLAQAGLRSAPVRIYPQGCRGLNAFGATNTLCFTTTNQVPLLCSADYGAPVFCRSSTTNENIVVGVVVGSNRCGQSNSFYVAQYPTF